MFFPFNFSRAGAPIPNWAKSMMCTKLSNAWLEEQDCESRLAGWCGNSSGSLRDVHRHLQVLCLSAELGQNHSLVSASHHWNTKHMRIINGQPNVSHQTLLQRRVEKRLHQETVGLRHFKSCSWFQPTYWVHCRRWASIYFRTFSSECFSQND